MAHGFTGNHDRFLTTPQFTLHTISILIFLLAVAVMHNRIFVHAGKKNHLSEVWPVVFFAPWVFWLGYYTLFVPFNILFMFLAIGIITAVQMKPFVTSLAKWIFLCIAGYFLAATAGIVIGLGAYLKYYKDIQGVLKDLATWFCISVPAALTLAFYFRPVLKRQILQEEKGNH